MTPERGIHRTAAADLLGIAVATLRHWERVGVLEKRGRGRGRWTPALYTAQDIVTARAVAFLRSQGTEPDVVSAARREMARLIPGGGHLVVRDDGIVASARGKEWASAVAGHVGASLVVDIEAVRRAVDQRADAIKAMLINRRHP